jgi:hypothetical protein
MVLPVSFGRLKCFSSQMKGKVMAAKRVVRGIAVGWIAALAGLAAVILWGTGSRWAPFLHTALPVHAASEGASSVTPLWLQSSGEDDPASVENDTPFPASKAVVNAQWTTPRYFPNPKVQAADIIPVTWASDGESYVTGDDGSVHEVKGTTVISRILGTPPTDNSVPRMDFKLLAHDPFLYGCPKSVTADSCYSVGLTSVNGVFYAPTYDKGYPVVGDHPPGNARMDYSAGPISQTSWVHGSVNFPKPVDSGSLSFVEIGRGQPSHDDCAGSAYPNGCIYAIVLHGGYQDPKDPNGMDQFIATHLFLARMASGTPEKHYQETADPLNWDWFTGFDSSGRPTWMRASDPHLSQSIRSLSYPRGGKPGCGAGDTADCLFWNDAPGAAGHINYPHMAYDAALHRYFLTFADWYYRAFRPPSEKGPMVQGGAEAIVLEAPHPWGPWSFVFRSPYLGSGNGYGPSFPVQWEGALTPAGQDLWMVWAANFSHCGDPILVPADRCQGVYGMNLRRLHLTLAGTHGAVGRPWYDQDVGFASPGSATVRGNAIRIVGNGNLSSAPDPFAQFKDKLYHDAFHFLYQRVQGDGAIEAEVHAPSAEAKSATGPEASAGLMIRESTYAIGQTNNSLQGQKLSSGDIFSEVARYAYVGVRKDGALFLQYRDGGQVVRSQILAGKCLGGCRLRISRKGDQITASYSSGGHEFHEVADRNFSARLSGTVTMGMVATSDSPSTFPKFSSYKAEFADFRVIGTKAKSAGN